MSISCHCSELSGLRHLAREDGDGAYWGVCCVTLANALKPLKQLQRFLGFANFYKRFIITYSAVAAPLTALTSTSRSFCWTPEAEATFTELKRWFVSTLVLVQPDLATCPCKFSWGGCFRRGCGCSALPVCILGSILLPFCHVNSLLQKGIMTGSRGQSSPLWYGWTTRTLPTS